MEKLLETAWEGQKFRWGRASGNHQGEANSVSQVDGFSVMVPACWRLWLCWGRAQKRNNGLCQHFCLGESWPTALVLMPDNSVPPHMSLMPFNLLLPCWSLEGVSLSKFMPRPLNRICLRFQQFLSSTASILSGFYSHRLWKPIFLALGTWDGEPSVGLEPLALEIFHPIFTCHTWV